LTAPEHGGSFGRSGQVATRRHQRREFSTSRFDNFKPVVFDQFHAVGDSLDITYSDPERSVACGRLIRGMEMELHSISFNDHKPLILMCAGKANSLIKGQGLLGFSHGEARSDCVKDWPARWCGWHVMLFLSRLQRSGAR